jgi:site-specific DNA-cytosine methylase
MKYGSVCSGIEAASVAWHNLGWEPQWFSEIEQFPSEVLKHRFPAVPNLGDMTTINQNPIADERPIDLLVGGTPCQSFSVAGLRKGLADPRGNLMLTFLSIADKFRPKWVVWENVPGVLSSNGGKDFGTFLGALGELGYGFAYRVLDAQYFGVAQRRRRVFVVGYLGDWRVAAAVLFERESLQGNTKPSRKKREEVASDAQESVGEAGDVSCVGGNLSPTVTSKWKTGYGGPSGSNETGNMVYAPTIIDQSEGKWISPNGEETIGTIMARDYKGLGNQDLEDGRGLAIRPHAVAQPIAFKVRGGCEGVGKGYLGQEEQAFTISTMQDQQIAQPIAVDTYNQTINERTSQTIGSSASDSNHIGAVLQVDSEYNTFVDKGINYGSTQKNNALEILRELRRKIGEKAFAQWGLGILNSLQSAQILQSDLHGNNIRPAAFSTSWPIYCKISRKEDDSSWLLQSLREAECERCSPQGWELSEQLHRELGSYLSELSCKGASSKRLMQDLWDADEGVGILRKALSEIQKVWQSANDKGESTPGSMRIRRLVPLETELLQGFPRNWTLIPYRNKPADQCPDGPRYKACGNSMAVPVMRWIGERINLIESII